MSGGPGAMQSQYLSALHQTGCNLLDSQGLGITNVGKVRDKLEAIDNCAASCSVALNSKAEDTAETALEVLLGRLVVGVTLETGIRDPADMGAVLEPLG